jgi:hypothetical protein
MAGIVRGFTDLTNGGDRNRAMDQISTAILLSLFKHQQLVFSMETIKNY